MIILLCDKVFEMLKYMFVKTNFICICNTNEISFNEHIF